MSDWLTDEELHSTTFSDPDGIASRAFAELKQRRARDAAVPVGCDLAEAVGIAADIVHENPSRHGFTQAELKLAEAVILLRDALRRERELSKAPVDMLLFCPRCNLQHVDAPHGDWTNPPHRSHECQGCHLVWRPADVPTNGVACIATEGKVDGSPDPTSYDAQRTAVAGLSEEERGTLALMRGDVLRLLAIYENDPDGVDVDDVEAEQRRLAVLDKLLARDGGGR
jgi:hypothetical protein